MEPLNVREYLRVSRDVQQTGRSPDQQHAENARAIQRRGWVLDLAPPYRDADRSASRYAKKPREDFKRLIGDLEANDFNADILAIWESSRGSRRVGEWVDLVDLCKERNVRIWVTTHDRLYDPANARDRRSLLEDAVDAEYESDKTSERRTRSARASADAGRPHGRNTYGFFRVYDNRTRELLRVEPHPDQAPVVREAASRILGGDSAYAIARDLNARNIPPRRGKRLPPYANAAWTPSAVRQMLQLPAYAGKRDYKGEIVGDGIWPELIDWESWQRLQAVLKGSKRRGPRDHTAKYLLSSIASCGVCQGPLRAKKQTYAPRKLGPDGEPVALRTYFLYVCTGVLGRESENGGTRWHVSIKASALHEIVMEMMFERFENSQALSSLGAHSSEARAESARLIADIATHEGYLEDVRQRAADERRFDLLLDQEKRVQPLIVAARARLDSLAEIDPFVLGVLRAGRFRLAWDALGLVDQRRVIRSVLLPVVHRAKPPGCRQRVPNRERVEVIWRE